MAPISQTQMNINLKIYADMIHWWF